ncbi:hypothetical protein D6789_03720 [Candidatus Woesearchaeota archaeon]|nr:MAG: hypothetical protein D6789_03720 [Candidatus Woesearchaeota archaeon]
MEDDVSRSTVIVLVLLTLAVSAIGTFVVLSEIDAGAPPAPSVAGKGQVMLSIEKRAAQGAAEATPVSGEVALTILEPR